MHNSPSVATTWQPSSKLIAQWKDLVGPKNLFDRFANFMADKDSAEKPTEDLTMAFYYALRILLRFRLYDVESVILTEEELRRVGEDMCKEARTRRHPLEHRLEEVRDFARNVFAELRQELLAGGKFFCKDNFLMYPPDKQPLWELVYENGQFVGVLLSQLNTSLPSTDNGEPATIVTGEAQSPSAGAAAH